MDDDRNWLKNPILPRPPAVPRFSAAELRLVDGDRPSSVVRVAPRRERPAPLESRTARQNGSSEVESEAPQSRRIA